MRLTVLVDTLNWVAIWDMVPGALLISSRMRGSQACPGLRSPWAISGMGKQAGERFEGGGEASPGAFFLFFFLFFFVFLFFCSCS